MISTLATVGVARGGERGHAPQKFLETAVILCFERRFSKENSVICLKSNILAPPQISGLATPLLATPTTNKSQFENYCQVSWSHLNNTRPRVRPGCIRR